MVSPSYDVAVIMKPGTDDTGRCLLSFPIGAIPGLFQNGAVYQASVQMVETRDQVWLTLPSTGREVRQGGKGYGYGSEPTVQGVIKEMGDKM